MPTRRHGGPPARVPVLPAGNITIDGAKGSRGQGYLFTINDFGLPTLYAIPAADRILRRLGARERVTLIVSGGLRDGADLLKALALEADACYVGTAILPAMGRAQIGRLMPCGPPYAPLRSSPRGATPTCSTTSRAGPEEPNGAGIGGGGATSGRALAGTETEGGAGLRSEAIDNGLRRM